ncbi:ankyrin repeat-containing protein [Anaeramoeba ignava]|uniref:Ankyrin repeat-containing protein n=1 Tax=Anaeramoeba ignava TaxID=1746090 RepID=A0A9Q0LBA7_ANAIG|nr:ankyrin repeat-containing protein [Anaeramoeba ignava]
MESIFDALSQSDYQNLKILLDSGIDPNITDNGYTPLFYICTYQLPLEFASLLLSAGADVNAKANRTLLQHACIKKVSLDVLELILTSGAEVNARTGKKTALHHACHHNCGIPLIKLLLDYGADLSTQDGKTPRDSAKSKELKEFLDSYESITSDMDKLFRSQIGCDITLTTCDDKISFHKVLFFHRVGHSHLEKIQRVFRSKTRNEVIRFMKWIYSGILDNRLTNYSAFEQELGIIDFKKKTGRNGLIIDLQKCYLDDKSKDFQIFVDSVPIPVHKFILIARSGLYRGMFSSVVDDSNKVTDYSGRSLETLQQLIKFFYIDSIDLGLSEDVLIELNEGIDFYQLSANTTLPYEIESSRKAREQQKV